VPNYAFISASDNSSISTSSVVVSSSSTVVLQTPSDVPDQNVTYEENYLPAPNFCFNQSQAWVGVDLPDCISNPDDPLCADPDSAMRLVRVENDGSDAVVANW
jgi:hypothetical protein